MLSVAFIIRRQLAEQPIYVDQAAGADGRLSVMVKHLTDGSGTGVKGGFDIRVRYPGAGAILDGLGGGYLFRCGYRLIPNSLLQVGAVYCVGTNTEMVTNLVGAVIGKPDQHGINKRPESFPMRLRDGGDKRRIIRQAAMQCRIDDIKDIELNLAGIGIITPASADLAEQCGNGRSSAVTVKVTAKRIPFNLQHLENPAA